MSKDLTVRELYEMLEPLLEEYGDFEVRVAYDSGFVATPIRNITPIIKDPFTSNRHVRFEGY